MNLLYRILIIVLLAAVVVSTWIALVAAPPFLAPVQAFFAGYGAQELIVGLILGVAFIFPQIGVTFLNFTKKFFGLEDENAHKMVIFELAAVVAVVMAVSSFALTDFTFTLKGLIGYLTEVYTLSQIAYNKLL